MIFVVETIKILCDGFYCLYNIYKFMSVCAFLIPLWQLGRSDVLAWGIYMAHHKVLSDLQHVFILEEAVEAQLVCSGTNRE